VAIIVEFRRRTLAAARRRARLSARDHPRLARSALHRCLQRYGIPRLPNSKASEAKRGCFAETKIGYVHIDVCELRCAKGKVHMFLRHRPRLEVHLSRIAPGRHHDRRRPVPARGDPAFPYRLHTVLTDNGIPFTDQPRNRSGPTAQYRLHAFDRICREHAITHKLNKPYHPWPNGQAKRMNRTVKDAIVRALPFETLHTLKAYLDAFITAYNFAKHLKLLRWRTAFQAICDA
jgi:transposase InsO family protein